MDIEKAITEGIVFKGGKSPNGKQEYKKAGISIKVPKAVKEEIDKKTKRKKR